MRRSDAELINSCKSGDETAWEEIVYRYRKSITLVLGYRVSGR